jgi:hypothetical protein
VERILVVKKRIQESLQRVTFRVKRSSISRRLTSGSSASLAARGIEWLYLIILFLFIAGVINAVINSSNPNVAAQVIVPSPSVQSPTETFVMLFTYIIGALGAYALYLSGRQTIRARSAEIFFVSGFLLMAFAMTIGYYVLSYK